MRCHFPYLPLASALSALYANGHMRRGRRENSGGGGSTNDEVNSMVISQTTSISTRLTLIKLHYIKSSRILAGLLHGHLPSENG